MEIERKRLAAQKLARCRGLSVKVDDEVRCCHLSITFHGDQSDILFCLTQTLDVHRNAAQSDNQPNSLPDYTTPATTTTTLGAARSSPLSGEREPEPFLE